MYKILFLLLVSFSPGSENILTGRWQSQPSEKGNVTSAVFTDGRFEGFINSKPFVSGIYTYSPADSTLFFIDNGCDKASALYKLMFYSNADSLRFKVINDNCEQRKNGMGRLIMGRVK